MAKLRWQCRRGTLELDRLLCHYLDNTYAQAEPAEQLLFQAFVQREDGELLSWLLGESLPNEQKLTHLVGKIRQTAG